MKKLTLIIAALALTLSLSQCKKQDNGSTADGVRITLTVGYGNDGAKTDFNPLTKNFVWSSGTTEWIYVGGSNHDECLGKLSGTGTGTGSMTFSGTLTTTPDDGETLHFFYLGKGRDGSAVNTLDFRTQDGTLENLTNYHIAVGDGSYTSGTINYATTLEMAMAIAYFDVSGFVNSGSTPETVSLRGDYVYTTATVDYRTGKITGSNSPVFTRESINIGTANSGKYVALIPSVKFSARVKFDSNSKAGLLTFNNGIQAGKYYANSGEALSVTANSYPFSVSAVKKVRFSHGNLQYIGSAATPYWRFATDQWRAFTGNTGQLSDEVNVDRDLFGWGTSGYSHGAVCYQPWSTSETVGDYYAYGSNSYNLYDQTGQADWGYNAIFNGGNVENSGWRTLTQPEWDYVINTRSTPSGIRYAKAKVFSEEGLILLPDDWNEGYYTLNNTNDATCYFTVNDIPEYIWETRLEAHGAVFLPTGGFREGTNLYNGDSGSYWSASCISKKAKSMGFSIYGIGFGTDDNRYYGKSVRLVYDVE